MRRVPQTLILAIALLLGAAGVRFGNQHTSMARPTSVEAAGLVGTPRTFEPRASRSRSMLEPEPPSTTTTEVPTTEVPTTVHFKPRLQPPSGHQAPGGDAKAFIYNHESGNNPARQNSAGCRGLGQACPGSKLTCGDYDYACQDAWFTNYMRVKYETWELAEAHWISKAYRCGNDWCNGSW